MRLKRMGPLCLGALVWAGGLHGEEPVHRPIIASTSPRGLQAKSEPSNLPPVSLGAPQSFHTIIAEAPPRAVQDDQVLQTSAGTRYLNQSFVARGQEPPPPPPPPGTIGDPIYGPDPVGIGAEPPPGGTFWGKCKNWLGLDGGPVPGCNGRGLFQSDHAFDNFISPVSSPFLSEDPRSLTEIKPLFFIQTTPSKNWVFHNGNAEFFGVQGRLALTERWSVVMNKLGFVALNPSHSGDPEFGSHVGFAEINIGPKYTFWRGDCSGTVAAAGVNFDLAAGNSQVFQNTGNLSIEPYLTIAQNFGRSQYGSFNVMGTGGYSFATDNKRSEYLFFNTHLDYDVGNLHRFYPLIELNWTHYTQAGTVRPLWFEGGDLVNFGSTGVSGSNNLNLAFGARYKFNEAVQVGTTFEFPIIGRHDINDFRWTIDLIFRY